jgi:hypothetical protein
MIAVSLDRVKPVIELQIELQRTQRQHRLRNPLSSGGDRIFPSLFYLGNFEQQSFHVSDPLCSPWVNDEQKKGRPEGRPMVLFLAEDA